MCVAELLVAELHFADRGDAESLQNALLTEKYIASCLGVHPCMLLIVSGSFSVHANCLRDISWYVCLVPCFGSTVHGGLVNVGLFRSRFVHKLRKVVAYRVLWCELR